MEAALVSVSTGVMKPLLSKLTKLLEDEWVKFKGVRKQIRFLRDELSAMSATLEILADAEQLNPEMRLWRDKLRELAYDLEDCIDGFMARVDHGQDGCKGFKKYYRKLKRFIARHEIANQIEELKASVMEASERHKRYKSFEIASNSSTYCAVDPRLSALYVEIDQLVGIDRPMKHIIKWLTMESKASSSEPKVLSIVGCGGLGKTTLANQVYKSVRSQFSCAAFVSVSRNPDVKKILRDIAEEVGIKDNMLYHDEKKLVDKLREHLKEKRYLIVIDDIWDAKPWETIKLALVNKKCDSRVITTTRSIAVAQCLSSQGNVYQMNSLSFEDSKRLLLKRAFGSENLTCAHLGTVPDEILKKCDGLPLAIITISSMLTDKHAKCDWDRVLNDIGSTLAKNPGAEKMTAILSLSYFDIPHHLRTCLLYLSVLPEDYGIEKQRLINRWIAEGFIHEDAGRTKYEVGEIYFNDLINRSMIQPVDVKYGQAKACQVHDIILDYIKCRAAEENFITSLDVAEHGYTSEHKVRRLCINSCNEETFTISSSLNLSHVRSLIMSGHPLQTSLLPLMALRVLDLRNCKGMEDHLASIEKLFHLKYLRLESDSVINLPINIGDLQYLETLDIRGTSIEELPSTIVKLKRLAYLYVDWGTKFPDGVIGQMHSLVHLKQYRVESYKNVKSLPEFSKLTKLRTLQIGWNVDWSDCSDGTRQVEDIQSYVGTFICSLKLHNLYFVDISPGFYPLLLDSRHPGPAAHPSCSLRKIHLQYCAICKVPNWIGSLGNLTVAELYIICMSWNDVEILGGIPSLIFLKLDTIGGTGGRIIVHGSNGFRNLKYFSLVITNCGSALKFEAGSMPKLEHLKLQFPVHVMECLSAAFGFGIQHLSALSKVKVQIRGRCSHDSNYDPAEERGDSITKCIASAIKTAVEALPNRPTISFRTVSSVTCKHFKCRLKELSQEYGVLAEWLKIWQTEEQT